MIRKIRTMEKPVIGMINGVAAGAGCSLALACDMRIMSNTAKLIEVFIRIALGTGFRFAFFFNTTDKHGTRV